MSVYDYEYEWDSRYCYPNSNVLKNKLRITDGAALAVAEREITAATVAGIMDKPVRGKEMIEASVLSFDKEYAKMNEMFLRITSPITQQEQQAFRKKLGLDRTERER
ncbi:hypothetical protein FACS18947_4700 [Bacteroidia bacterium]|nr:hypothetical protein FACS18947_4700 [Bacteroidia bacterium]